jgi:hypothetical protein
LSFDLRLYTGMRVSISPNFLYSLNDYTTHGQRRVSQLVSHITFQFLLLQLMKLQIPIKTIIWVDFPINVDGNNVFIFNNGDN